MAQITLNSSGVASSGSLVLQSNGTTSALTIDTAQNAGLGVAPSAWGSIFKAIQGSGGGALAFRTDAANVDLLGNAYYNGTSFIYQKTGYNATRYRLDDAGAHAWFNAASGTAGGTITFTQAMTLDASGNLGVGTTSPSQRLDATVSSSTEGSGLAVTNSLTGGYGSGLTMYSVRSDNSAKMVAGRISMSGASSWNSDASTSSDMLFGTISANSFAERMRLTASGNLLVGTTSTPSGSVGGAGFVRESNSRSTLLCATTTTSAMALVAFLNPNGTVGTIQTSGTATSYVTSSDYRLKENIAPMTGALATVAQLNPVTYNWKVDGSEGQGFIAHELQAVVPDAVVGAKDAVDEEGNPVYQGIDTSFLVATLTAALQEAHGLIKDLQTRVAALES